jgi:hypothetical protein
MSRQPKGRIPHRRLNRPEIYRQLERFQRKWNKLDFVRFLFQAESEMNPEHTNEPDNNFGLYESVRGFLTRIPVRRRPYRARQYLDNLNRPDKYAIYWANVQIRKWNLDAAHADRLVYKVPYIIQEVHPATRRTPEYTMSVWHDYVQTLRGEYAVRQIDSKLVDVGEGIEEARLRIQSCVDEKRVVAAVQEVLNENERIQNGNGTV